jgi:ribonuclease HII
MGSLFSPCHSLFEDWELFSFEDQSKCIFENMAWSRGCRRIAGIDEVGRGALAGPVVAACVQLDPQRIPPGIDDSKKLNDRERRLLNEQILRRAVAVGLGSAAPDLIDRVNVYNATKLAMKAALLSMPSTPDFLFIDAVKLHDISISCLSITKGDQRSVSIAAASIVAKVYRDDLMIEYAERYPEYRFAAHKGYGTAVHVLALKRFGPSVIHRFSFTPVWNENMEWKSRELF